MTKTFLNRILCEGIVDTRQYRYRLVGKHNHNGQWQVILRIPRRYLDMARVYTGWVTAWTGN